MYDWTGPDPDDWTLNGLASRTFVWSGWRMLLEMYYTSGMPVRKYTWGLDLSGQAGSSSAPGTPTPSALEGAGGTLDTPLGHQGQVGGLLAIDDPSLAIPPNDPYGQFVCFFDANGNVGQLVSLSTDRRTDS